MSDHTDTTLTDTEREQAIIDTAHAMHTCTSHPDYPEYDEVPCSGQTEAHCDMGHEHGSRGVCWCCEPLAAAVVDDVLAPIVAARVAAARAERDALWRQRLTELPNQMSGAWGGGAPWLTTGDKVATLVGDWLSGLIKGADQ